MFLKLFRINCFGCQEILILSHSGYETEWIRFHKYLKNVKNHNFPPLALHDPKETRNSNFSIKIIFPAGFKLTKNFHQNFILMFLHILCSVLIDFPHTKFSISAHKNYVLTKKRKLFCQLIFTVNFSVFIYHTIFTIIHKNETFWFKLMAPSIISHKMYETTES